MKTAIPCLLFAFALFSGCSSDDGNTSTNSVPAECPKCQPGTQCDQTTKKCVPIEQGKCSPACSGNTICGLDSVCKCQPGYDDCNNDLGKGGNGCECNGECTNGQCNAKTCDVNGMRACGDATQYCNNGVCAACPGGSFNCDGTLDCEADKECGSEGCELFGKTCGSQTLYCDEATSTCKPCKAGTFNCGMTGGECSCESQCDGSICRNECDTTAGCDNEGQFCDFGKCEECPTGRKNCNGSGECECEGTCNGAECQGNKLCDYYDENVCGGNVDQWCNNGTCQACSQAGEKNCNKTKGCECPGGCNGNVCVGACSGGECCGEQACQFGEICVIDALQTGSTHRCVELPSTCMTDQTCSCLGAAACPNDPYKSCVDGSYNLTCECPNC